MIESLIAKRMGGRDFFGESKIYKFEMIKRAKHMAAAVNPGIEMIDMGVGEPDRPADNEIGRILFEEACKKENRFYADNGIPEFQEAAAEYMKSFYGVSGLDPAKEILHGIGSKPILAMLPLCFIDPGDVFLTTSPGYPIHGTYTEYLGGEVFKLPLKEENSFFPVLKDIPGDVLKRAKALYINYPNNPTGKAGTEDFFKEVVEFAGVNNILVVHDAAYSSIVFGANKPLSFLSIEGAKKVGVEVHSLSKAYNMTGWRLAFIAGNEKIIKAYGAVKDNTDSGQFRAIQKAGVYALNHPELIEENCRRYSRRFDLLTSALKQAGFQAAKPGGTFYCYTKAPVGTEDGIRFSSAAEAAEFIIKHALISTVPWDDAGAYLRVSVTFEADSINREKEIVNEAARRLKKLKLIF